MRGLGAYRYADGSTSVSEKLTIGGQATFRRGRLSMLGWVSDEGLVLPWRLRGASERLGA